MTLCTALVLKIIIAEQEEEPEMVAAVFSGLHSLSMEELKFASEACPELNLLKTQIQARWPRDNKDILTQP